MTTIAIPFQGTDSVQSSHITNEIRMAEAVSRDMIEVHSRKHGERIQDYIHPSDSVYQQRWVHSIAERERFKRWIVRSSLVNAVALTVLPTLIVLSLIAAELVDSNSPTMWAIVSVLAVTSVFKFREAAIRLIDLTKLGSAGFFARHYNTPRTAWALSETALYATIYDEVKQVLTSSRVPFDRLQSVIVGQIDIGECCVAFTEDGKFFQIPGPSSDDIPGATELKKRLTAKLQSNT